jgi:FixJ family two-component response regulator
MDGDEDGIITAQRIGREAEIPIIFITASTNRNIFSKAKNENPVDILCKPFIESDLINTIKRAVQNKLEN